MNSNERLVAAMLEKRGFSVLRNGWPDFLCLRKVVKPARIDWNGDKIFPQTWGLMAVEVKAGQDKLSNEQQLVHRALKSVRIPVYVIRPDEIKDQLKVRHFLTNEEIRNLESIADKTRDKIHELRAEAKELEHELDRLDAMIGASSEILKESGSVLEECALPSLSINRSFEHLNDTVEPATWALLGNEPIPQPRD